MTSWVLTQRSAIRLFLQTPSFAISERMDSPREEIYSTEQSNLELNANARTDMKEPGEGSAEKDVEMESFKAEILVFQMRSGITAAMMGILMTATAAVQIVGLRRAGTVSIKTVAPLFVIPSM